MSTNTAEMANYHPQASMRKPEDYADIITHERPQAKRPMSIADRAAQFSPYAALVGHKDVVASDEAKADARVDLDQDITLELEDYL